MDYNVTAIGYGTFQGYTNKLDGGCGVCSDTEITELLNEQLQAIDNSIPRRDILMVAGDWNANVSPADPSTHYMLEKCWQGQRCSNRDRLINFADFNGFLVVNNRFQQLWKHLLT